MNCVNIRMHGATIKIVVKYSTFSAKSLFIRFIQFSENKSFYASKQHGLVLVMEMEFILFGLGTALLYTGKGISGIA